MKTQPLPPRARGLSSALDAAIWDAHAAALDVAAVVENRGFRLKRLVARADKAHRALANLSRLAWAEMQARQRKKQP